MSKPCIPRTGVEKWESYVHLKDKIAITTQKELFDVCWNCREYLSCDYVLRLFTLLSVNNKEWKLNL